MHPNLLPADPLSQVVFIHDYLQLVFQDSYFTIYNTMTIRSSETLLQQGEVGFCDGLVGLMGKSLVGAVTNDESSLTLSFQGDTILLVATNGTGPEAWEFNSVGNLRVVEQNS